PDPLPICLLDRHGRVFDTLWEEVGRYLPLEGRTQVDELADTEALVDRKVLLGERVQGVGTIQQPAADGPSALGAKTTQITEVGGTGKNAYILCHQSDNTLPSRTRPCPLSRQAAPTCSVPQEPLFRAAISAPASLTSLTVSIP